jgi:DNA-binding MarR family transcriptional regulator
MADEPDVGAIASALLSSLSALVRRVRKLPVEGELTMPEWSALARLDRSGSATSAELARQELISPQSMGATLGALQARGLIERHPDPDDGRRVVLALTDAGVRALKDRRNARSQLLEPALASTFTRAELEQLAAAAPLLKRLAGNIGEHSTGIEAPR